LVTVHHIAINNHESNVHNINNTHLQWTRANSNKPLFRGLWLVHHMDEMERIHEDKLHNKLGFLFDLMLVNKTLVAGFRCKV
jgi:hypothetical protein